MGLKKISSPHTGYQVLFILMLARKLAFLFRENYRCDRAYMNMENLNKQKASSYTIHTTRQKTC